MLPAFLQKGEQMWAPLRQEAARVVKISGLRDEGFENLGFTLQVD